MPDTVFPISFTDKIDSPDLVAYFAQFPETSYLSAAQINIIKAALNELNLRVPEGLPIDDAIVNGVTDRAPSQNAVFDELALKLDASAYNDRFKGKFTTLLALQTAFPTANAGDYAQVDAGSGSNVVNYNYDSEEGWVEGSSTPSASNTDELPEGSSNLYFTTARVLATVLTGISFATGGAIVSTDSVLVAFGKLQNQITNLLSNNLGTYLWGLTAKTTPVNADTITINDTADSNNLKKVTLTNLWNNYFKPLVQTKRSHTVIFTHYTGVSDFTNWYTKTRTLERFGAVTYTAYGTITPTNDFADDQYYGFTHIIPFQCKVKNVFCKMLSNQSGSIPIDVAIQTVEFPNGNNIGVPANGVNPKIIARETVTQISSGSQPNVKFASGSLVTTHTIAEKSLCKLFFKNLFGASAGAVEMSIIVEFEEV